MNQVKWYCIGETKTDEGKCTGGTGILRMRQKVVYISPALFILTNTSKHYLSSKWNNSQVLSKLLNLEVWNKL